MSDLKRTGGLTPQQEPRAVAHRYADEASDLLQRLFRGFDGSLALRLWNGTTLRLGNSAAHSFDPSFTLVCHHPGFVRSMVLGRDPLRLAEAYFQGDIDVEGDFFAALCLKDHLNSIRLSLRDRLGALFTALRLHAPCDARPDSGSHRSTLHGHAVKAHSRTENRAAISFHYDVSNEFYRLWLDEERVYSCAYFKSPDESLDQAQRNKLEHVCRKLRLQPGDRLLDIGCGWGALVCWAARHHGVRAHGITLSRQQLEVAQQRIFDEGLQDSVTVKLCDYRDLEGAGVFDKVSSIGMFEHVGLANLPTYLRSGSEDDRALALMLAGQGERQSRRHHQTEAAALVLRRAVARGWQRPGQDPRREFLRRRADQVQLIARCAEPFQRGAAVSISCSGANGLA